jgi:hypothetical protein
MEESLKHSLAPSSYVYLFWLVGFCEPGILRPAASDLREIQNKVSLIRESQIVKEEGPAN